MQIGVAATPDVAIPTLEWLLQSEHEIALVITQPDRPAGRGRELKQSIVADWATTHNIPVIKPEKSQELIGSIEQLDLVLTIGYGTLLPEEVLALPRYGFLNLHFSLLPSYRGAAPVQRALQNGESSTGVTVFQLEKGMDTGPIFTQTSIEIDSRWRSVELFQHLAEMGPAVVARSFEMILTNQQPSLQDGIPSYAPKISKAEARIDFQHDSHTVINLIRAFTYEPGAWTTWKSEPFKICDANFSAHTTKTSGQIEIVDNSVLVSTGSGVIEILTVIPAGKKEMAAIDWARGARLSDGDIFG